MTGLNETHDPARQSWIESANATGADFPIQNLPYGVFSVGAGDKRVGVAIGDYILDLSAAEKAGIVRPSPDGPVFDRGDLNAFMALPQATWRETRRLLASLLDAAAPDRAANMSTLEPLLTANTDATMHLPIFVRSYTDFYSSREHSTNVGTMFRGAENALPPNWLHMPIGYNGRASTVVVSGTPVHRPLGQLKGPSDTAPRFGPCEKLDIELEMGAIVGTPSTMGQPVTTAEAYEMIFGYVILNDWSARDIQVWEYQPLGPFQAKACATTISPWIVTTEALEPFRRPTPARETPLLPYLHEAADNNFDIALEVALAPAGGSETVVSRTNYKEMYFSAAQQVAHHASSGCAMCTGDLLGSGTISGKTPASYGSLLEMSWNGRDPIQVDGGQRSFIEDGDVLTLRGWCEGAYRIGFGACAGQVLPSVDFGQ